MLRWNPAKFESLAIACHRFFEPSIVRLPKFGRIGGATLTNRGIWWIWFLYSCWPVTWRIWMNYPVSLLEPYSKLKVASKRNNAFTLLCWNLAKCESPTIVHHLFFEPSIVRLPKFSQMGGATLRNWQIGPATEQCKRTWRLSGYQHALPNLLGEFIKRYFHFLQCFLVCSQLGLQFRCPVHLQSFMGHPASWDLFYSFLTSRQSFCWY